MQNLGGKNNLRLKKIKKKGGWSEAFKDKKLLTSDS
jgi:hypothetical protein